MDKKAKTEGELKLFSFCSPKKSKGCDSEDDMSVHEEEFYYQEVAVDHMSSPPTMSHRDMARPPHEDPEYQKQLRLEATPTASNYIENVMVGVREPSNTFTISQSPVGNHAFRLQNRCCEKYGPTKFYPLLFF